MNKRIIIITTFSFILTACAQTQPRTDTDLPVINAYRKAQQIHEIAEEYKEEFEKFLDGENDGNKSNEQVVLNQSGAENDIENTTIDPRKQKGESDTENKYYSVVKVVDGDTIDVDIDGKTERIRVIGLNTPETVDPRKPVECFGQEASKKALELLFDREVKLESDSTQDDRDKYGRLLRYIYLKDGTDFSLKMIKDGYGYEYTYELPYKNQKQYDEAEAYARENQLGLWAPGLCAEE